MTSSSLQQKQKKGILKPITAPRTMCNILVFYLHRRRITSAGMSASHHSPLHDELLPLATRSLTAFTSEILELE